MAAHCKLELVSIAVHLWSLHRTCK